MIIMFVFQERHQDGDHYALNIDEILDETQQMDVNQQHKFWLVNEVNAAHPTNNITHYNFQKLKDGRLAIVLFLS